KDKGIEPEIAVPFPSMYNFGYDLIHMNIYYISIPTKDNQKHLERKILSCRTEYFQSEYSRWKYISRMSGKFIFSKNYSAMSIPDQIKNFFVNLPANKRIEMETLHRRILELLPDKKLWYLDGRDETGKVVTNPT